MDAYFYPYLGKQPHDVASVTKSITSTLVGIAVDRGSGGSRSKVIDFFGNLAPSSGQKGKAAIELEHLLTMSSGLACGVLPAERELYVMLAGDHYVRYARAPDGDASRHSVFLLRPGLASDVRDGEHGGRATHR